MLKTILVWYISLLTVCETGSVLSLILCTLSKCSVLNQALSISEALTKDLFLDTSFKHTVPSLGTINQKFIFQTIKTQSLQTCGVACFARSLSTPSCHFFLLNGNSVCLMGNIFTAGANGNTQTLTAYLNEGE
jgi:hypothetical protein